MPLLQWETQFSVQVESLDDDHRGLIAELNALWRVVAEKAGRDVVHGALLRAYSAMEDHFRREEAVLERWRYPRLRGHAREHRRLLARLGGLVAALDGGDTDSVDLKALDFIGDWLCNHILRSDRRYGRFISQQTASADPPSSEPSVPKAGPWFRRRGWRLSPLIILGLMASVGLFLVVSHSEKAKEEAFFHELAEQRITAVKSNLDYALDSVGLLVGHFAVTERGDTNRDKFRRMLAPTLAGHRFIQALSWNPRVTGADRQDFERRVRADGFPGFAIFERDGAGATVLPGNRDEFVPILYIEPLVGNAKAVGFDLASDPVRRQALDQARSLRMPRATSRITLVQEGGNQFGVLVLAPVFRGEPADVVPSGYVSAVFRVGDLIAESGGQLKRSQSPRLTSFTDVMFRSTATVVFGESIQAASAIDVHLFDLSSPVRERQLYPRGPQRSPEDLMAGLHSAVSFDVAGRSWLVVATPGKAFTRVGRVPLDALITLVAGLLSTIFLVYYQGNSLERVENSAMFAREVARTKQRLSEAHRIARLGFIERDSAEGIWRLGEGTQAMLGIDPLRTEGSSAEIFANVDPEERAGLLDLLAVSGGSGIDVELRVGERVLHALAEVACADPAQVPRVITFQDITQRRTAERERAAMIERMAEASRLESLGTLAGGVAHEINTPAQYISDNLSFIQEWLPRLLDVVKEARAASDSGDWAVVAERAKAINYDFAAHELPVAADQALDGIGRVSAIVQAIREFSYPSSKTPQPFDLNRAVEMASTVTRNQWKYVAEVNLDLAPDLPLLDAIEGEINQILVNLIVNATHAIAEKGSSEPGRIDLQTRVVDDFVELAVADTGIGIPKANLDRLFELFFTTKPPGEGTGQGLAITKAIVLRHGGTITVESEPGLGACFLVRLPIVAYRPLSAENVP